MKVPAEFDPQRAVGLPVLDARGEQTGQVVEARVEDGYLYCTLEVED